MDIFKNNIKNFLGVFISLIALASCENDGYDDYTAQNTPSMELNGEWYIDISDDSRVLAQHVHHYTYDTNDGNNTMYIDDKKAGYWIKGKMNIDSKNLTFSVTNAANMVDPGTTFTVTEGKILKGAARSKDGNVTDSIYFKAEFSYDPGTIITFAGHKRTGFLEDEY